MWKNSKFGKIGSKKRGLKSIQKGKGLGRGLADQQDGYHTVRLGSAGDSILPLLLVSSRPTPVSHWERRREDPGGSGWRQSDAQMAEIVPAGRPGVSGRA
ncbi:hypothetical protein NDU88_008047 [Pleurodeles waltl]|uniref:Uncharacterized protein n=1 Tax=Pleurodeles waltl TaxID=8319 RepID=A0AAV7RR70_PLEWA|nr:hypothetical protein NDU88_008047 [Pleurodeles waltl]